MKFGTPELTELETVVHDAYTNIAEAPEGDHPFPVGRSLALALGYPPSLLNSLPGVAVDAFSGVSNVSVWADIRQAETVLDLGCGGGLDTLVALSRGANVIAVDFSASMLARARQAVQAADRAGSVRFFQARANLLPLPHASVDVVLVNGIFNLNLDRAGILGEMHRVLTPGGRVYAAELITLTPSKPRMPDQASWVA